MLATILAHIFLTKMEFVVTPLHTVAFVMRYEMIWTKSKITLEISPSIMLDTHHESHLVSLVAGAGSMSASGSLYKLRRHVFWRNKMKINLMATSAKCGDSKLT